MSRKNTSKLYNQSLIGALIGARSSYGKSKIMLEDQDRKPLSYNQIFQGLFALSSLFHRHLGDETRIGLMMPNAVGGTLSFFALQAMGRVPVMINFTAGQINIKAGLKTTQVKTIITARRFIETAKLEDLIESLKDEVRILYLDDLRKHINLGDKLYALVASTLPKTFAKKTKPEDLGVILFTSGSFGVPRGVALSHSNLVANTRQIEKHFKVERDWIIFSPLPVFHSLGLTGGIILPLLAGLRCFQYPSPLHVKIIPKLVKDSGATMFFSTDSFINQYARQAAFDDFKNLKFIVCGAEKVREETHNIFDSQFGGITILEGYGVTECSPVVAVNTLDDNRHGTVGRVLPDIETRLEPVEGIHNGGQLFVKGPNIMAGYINPEAPDLIDPPKDGWHDTGDIVDLDADGFIRILGRLKRFAKISGEMISLTAVERIADDVWPGHRNAVVSIADDKKGERLILFTENPEASSGPLAEYAKQQGYTPLYLPRVIVTVDSIPVLGSGKTDYVSLQKQAEMQP